MTCFDGKKKCACYSGTCIDGTGPVLKAAWTSLILFSTVKPFSVIKYSPPSCFWMIIPVSSSFCRWNSRLPPRSPVSSDKAVNVFVSTYRAFKYLQPGLVRERIQDAIDEVFLG